MITTACYQWSDKPRSTFNAQIFALPSLTKTQMGYFIRSYILKIEKRSSSHLCLTGHGQSGPRGYSHIWLNGDVPLQWVVFLQEILKHGSRFLPKNP